LGWKSGNTNCVLSDVYHSATTHF